MVETGLSDDKMTGIPSKIFIYAIFLAYPLVFHNYYYDIVTCKYIVLIAMTLLLLLFTLIMDGRAFLNQMHLIPSDYAVLGLFIVNLCSVAGSEYKIYALNGADGRFSGLVTLFLYVIIYFIISRVDFNRDRFYVILAAGSMIVSVLGILNFADIDILGFYRGLQIEQKQFYMSTLGHVNVYSSYFSLTIPVLLMNYLKTEKTGWTIFYFVSCLINIMALLCGGCESAAVIILTAGVCAFLCCKRLHMLRWVYIMFFTLLLNKPIIYINNQSAEPRVLSSTVRFLSDNRVVAGGLVLGLCLIAPVYLLHRRGKDREIKYCVVFLSILIPAAYLIALVYFSVVDRNIDLHRMENFLRFSDEFGSYRGYIWKVVVREFGRLSPYHMFFGIGTDSLRPYLADRYGESMYQVTMAYYDNAHNEFLQYLITTGIAGLGMYVLFLFMQIRKAMRKTDRIILCGVVCYLVQSAVNLNQVVTTPLFVVMVSMFSDTAGGGRLNKKRRKCTIGDKS